MTEPEPAIHIAITTPATTTTTTAPISQPAPGHTTVEPHPLDVEHAQLARMVKAFEGHVVKLQSGIREIQAQTHNLTTECKASARRVAMDCSRGQQHVAALQAKVSQLSLDLAQVKFAIKEDERELSSANSDLTTETRVIKHMQAMLGASAAALATLQAQLTQQMMDERELAVVAKATDDVMHRIAAEKAIGLKMREELSALRERTLCNHTLTSLHHAEDYLEDLVHGESVSE